MLRTRNYVTHRTQPNLWLGQPATQQGVVPVSAGIATPVSASIFSAPGLVMSRSSVSFLEVQNRYTSAMPVAIVGFMQDKNWVAGQWVDSGTTYNDTTSTAQAGVSNGFALETTTQNDGFIVGATNPFGAISLDITTAGSGTTASHTIEYWNGTAWVGILAAGMLIDIARTSTDWPTGEYLILFTPPGPWAKGGSGTNTPQTTYNIRIKRTNATQATAALARRIYIGSVLFSADALAVNGIYSPDVCGAYPMDIPDYITNLNVAVGNADVGNNITVIQAVTEQV
jgi:hypothetical protein